METEEKMDDSSIPSECGSDSSGVDERKAALVEDSNEQLNSTTSESATQNINSPSPLDPRVVFCDNLSAKVEKFRADYTSALKLNMDDRHRAIMKIALSLCELLEQLCLFGKRHLKISAKPQIDKIIECMQNFANLTIYFEANLVIKITGCGLFRKEAVPKRKGVDYEKQIVVLYAQLVESLFLCRVTIIEIQCEVLNEESIRHSEQTNRMKIIQYTISRLDPSKYDSHDEILVCLGLLDNFACEYFHAYGGQLASIAVSKVTKIVWEMEKAMSAGRLASSRQRDMCIQAMLQIILRVTDMSTEKAAEAMKKLEGKLEMLKTARAEELEAWSAMENKLSSSDLKGVLKAYKSASLVAESRLTEKLEQASSSWNVVRAESVQPYLSSRSSPSSTPQESKLPASQIPSAESEEPASTQSFFDEPEPEPAMKATSISPESTASIQDGPGNSKSYGSEGVSIVSPGGRFALLLRMFCVANLYEDSYYNGKKRTDSDEDATPCFPLDYNYSSGGSGSTREQLN